MQCLQIGNSEVMETELLCDLVEVVVSLNVQVSFLGFVSNQSSSFRSFLPASEAMTYSVSDFLFSVTAIRLPGMFVFVFSSVLLQLQCYQE